MFSGRQAREYLHTSRAVEEGGTRKKKGGRKDFFFFFLKEGNVSKMFLGYFLGERSFLSSVQDGVKGIISFFFFPVCVCWGSVQPQAMLFAFICLIKA